jgi:hypothetical protein
LTELFWLTRYFYLELGKYGQTDGHFFCSVG